MLVCVFSFAYKTVRISCLYTRNCLLETLIKTLNSDLSLTLPPASTARHLYLRGGAGVGSMTKIYGGRQRNGVMPSHFSRGSKSVARRVLQALEGLKMVEKDQDG